MRVERRRFRSLEAYQAISLQNVNCTEILQLSRGKFDFSMQRVDLGDLVLEWNQLNVACRIRETFVPDGLLIGIPLDRGSVTLEGSRIDSDSVLVWRSGQELEYAFAPGTRGLYLLLSGVLLARMEIPQSFSPVRTLQKPNLQEVIDVCRAATLLLQSHDASGDDALQHAATVVGARERILSALIPALATWNAHGKEPNKAVHSHYWPLIKQAEALMWAGQPPASSDSMAELLGVSRRTLFHAFRTSLGMGPYQFDRLIRLHQLRRALIHAFPESSQVTVLAVDHGFSHLGRLSVDYRNLFGESPRTTLGRAPTVAH